MSSRIVGTAFCLLPCTAALAAPQQPTVVVSPAPNVPVDPTVEGWPNYAHDMSHNARSNVRSQPMNRILWSTPVDQQPQYSGADLLVHYGSPLITPAGTILVTVKTGVSGTFQMEGRHASNGALIWTQTTDYVLPSHNWMPSCGSAITSQNVVAIPAAGGTVLMRTQPDLASGTATRVCFYGIANYNANPSAYDSNVIIDTPITSDRSGNIYFGFLVQGSTPVSLTSGIARITPAGTGTWVSAATAANDSSIRRVVYNCTPALTPDGSSVYVVVTNTSASGFGNGYLLKLDSTTLAQQARVRLKDAVNTSTDANLADDGTASPMVGPDGDVYIGVLESPFGYNNLRGFMRHFDSTLTVSKPSGAFGWDDTASVVPRGCVPQYTGTSSYLILTKYNNYIGTQSGNGHNMIAVLDPNATAVEPVTNALLMAPVITVLGVTPDPGQPAGAVREWCINTAAIDVAGRAAIINSEDGTVYHWDFATNSLTQSMALTNGIGEAYTPTLIGPNGIVLAVSNATLYVIGR